MINNTNNSSNSGSNGNNGKAKKRMLIEGIILGVVVVGVILSFVLI